jgi:hypothetical protein
VTAVGLVTIAVALVAASAAGAFISGGVSNVSGAIGLNGWRTSNVTVTWSWNANGFSGEHQEFITGATCTGDSGPVQFGYDSALYTSFGASITLTEESPSTGAVCNVDGEARDELGCSIFGCWYTDFYPTGAGPYPISLKIDKTGPVNTTVSAPPPNANGWYNTRITAVWSAQDPISGILSCPGQQIPAAETSGSALSGQCRNGAGLFGPFVFFPYKYDATDPTLDPSVSPNPVTVGGAATASAGATDNRSGVDTESCDPVDTSAVGSFSVSCTATDNAGNSSSASADYDVVYGFDGFYQPVDNAAVNVANAGQTIPLKFRVVDADGNGVSTITSASVTATSLTCDLGETQDLLEEYSSGDGGLQTPLARSGCSTRVAPRAARPASTCGR